MPFRSTAQQRFAFGTGQPWAKRWAQETDFAKLPRRVKRIRSRMGLKGCTCKAVATETPSAAPTATPATAPAKGGSLGPGITRIRGNLCNVHGRYGPCDAALSKKKPKGGKGRAAKPKKAPKPKLTDQQRAAARDEKKRANAADVAKRMSNADTGLSSTGSAALIAMRTGAQPDATQGPGLVTMGLAEQARDGSYRMTPTGRAVVGAMESGDYQRAVDTISRGTDTATARTGRQTAAAQRRQDVSARRAASEAKRQAAQQERAAKRAAAAAAKKPSAGGRKQPSAPAKRAARLSKRGSSFSGGGGSSGGASAAAPKKPAAPKIEKPSKEQAQADNRAAVRDAMAQADQGLAPGGFDNLIALGGGKEPDDIGAQGLISMGMAERGSDGTLRLTTAGRQAITAANRGDAKAAIDVISRASEPMKTKAQTDSERAMFAKMGGGGGGGGGGSGGGSKLWPKGPSGKRTPQAAAAQAGGGGGDKGDSKPTGSGGLFAAPAKGETKRETIGASDVYARTFSDGTTHYSVGNRTTTDRSKADKWIRENNRTHAANEKRRAGDEKRAAAESEKRHAAEQQKRDAHQLDRDRHAARDKLSTLRKRIAEGDDSAATKRSLDAWQKKYDATLKESTFTIYKDATGADRWVSVSSTAYRDRDKEIVSTKALTGAVALADASGLRGPLRFWHVPGVELGDCDYQATAQDGRFLIESGTFRSPALAAAVKSHADDYQLSIGFTHPPNEPDSHGVFSNIAIFERSLVPRGRASNPLTQLTLVTKEVRMLTSEKQAELTRLLDGNGELLAGLLDRIATTDKAAQDGGVAYKDAPDLRAIIREELASLLSGTTEKAAPPPMMAEGTPEEEAAESPEEEQTEMDAGEGDAADENMLTSAEITAIAQQTAQVLLDALMPHLGIGQKMDEVKSMLGGMAGSYAKKDAELAEVKETLATVQAQVADLSGGQPRIMAGGYRPSQSNATITTDDKLKEAQPSADPRMAAFSDFLGELGLTQPAQPGV